ncbi:MAG TPA: hypothetical protein VN636_18865 [Acidimicrobiia bacterium]|nr:hypothetical protein [Acidimicrobiia bacterium]
MTRHLRRCFHCGRAIVLIGDQIPEDLVARCAECIARFEHDDTWMRQAAEDDAQHASQEAALKAQAAEWELQHIIEDEYAREDEDEHDANDEHP